MYDPTERNENRTRRPEPLGLQLPLQAPPVERSATALPRGAADAPGVQASAVPWKSILGGALDLLPF
ncbi:hypothetical protein [Streptomyces sp. NPDC049555]|uniref:hypothetical protein n=1 Tax=Streptomyces sp. NPDC049555 TaxID=3154930 RepID=UPI00343527BA